MICLHQKNTPGSLTGSNNLSPGLKSQAFLEFITHLERLPLLAHHPACKYYHHHIIWLGKLPLCLGCSMMTCGIGAGILLITHWQLLTTLPFPVLLSIGVLLYLPAIGQIWMQFKPYKIVARFSLGVAVVCLFYAGIWLTPWSLMGWVLKAGFIANFSLVWTLTLKIRSQYATCPCHNCPEGRFPICSYTIPRISTLANKYFSASDGRDPEADDFVRALQSVYTSHSR